MQNDSRNTVIFVVCMMVMLLAYQLFILGPASKRREAERQTQAAAAASQHPGVPVQAALTISRAEAQASSPRIAIETPALKGSVALKGARFDDLFLSRYHQTLDPKSPPVELFRPQGAVDAYFAEFGWIGANLQGLPGLDTLWTASGGGPLAPGHPIVLSYRSPQGLAFTRTIAVDPQYMFTVTDTVANQGAAPVAIAPFGEVQRRGLPPDILRAANVHQGAVGWLGDGLKLQSYRSWKKKGEVDETSHGGWLGITDKYWLAALIPDQAEQIRAFYRAPADQAVDVYDVSYLGASRTIPAGQQITVTNRLFAGAKIVPLLTNYQNRLGIPEFKRAVDWGRLFFLTQPIFDVLEFFSQHTLNFGVAILLLTVCVRLLFFWPANKSYESMTKMKKVQPELEKIRSRNKEDPAKQQQEMMQLYQREKINPLLGCLPMLLTIPVFFALYKVLSVTIEMRQAHFFWFAKDLSERDPTTIWNLFGLGPWDPGAAPIIGSFLNGPLHIGIWALLYGLTMWLVQSMSPQTGMDATQQKMLQLFPLVFTFVMSQFAVGLLIYYTWSNLLSLAQQYVIMRRFKVDNPIDGIIRKVTGGFRTASG